MKLKDVKTVDQLEQYEKWIGERLEKGEITEQGEYMLYNRAFKQVYGHDPFDKNGNSIKREENK